jgi:4-diphosphocytidyl-2-C-methyl-D-erythritol kinase
VSEPDVRYAITRRAPAKLNLTLAVLGRRPDGFHALHSVMAPLAFGDEVIVEPGRGTEDKLEIEDGAEPGTGGLLSAGPDNLVLRAIAAARSFIAPGRPTPPQTLDATLVKRIPVAAGLGGGSSDAAAAIDAALEAWHATLPRPQALQLAASVGSDVPFFLARGIALVTGRGEYVEPLASIVGEPPGILLVTPNAAVSTADVFRSYAAGARSADPDRARATSEALADSLRRGMSAADLVATAGELATANDLVPAARATLPELGLLQDALAELLGVPVGQSGSGPTLWAVYETEARATFAADLVREAVSLGRLPLLPPARPFIAATSISAG